MTREERLAALGFELSHLPLERVTACNLCGSDRFVQIARRDRYALPMRTSLCEACGLVFLNPRPTAEGYREFYARHYRPLVTAYTGRAYDDPAVLAAEQADYARRLDEQLLSDHLRPHHRTLLDVGGSTGGVARHFVECYGLRAVCLDPSPQEADAARNQGIETVTGLVEDYDPGDRRFDVILLCQTVDHLLDVGGALAKIHHWLAEDGLFFVDPLDFRAMLRRQHGVVPAVKIDHPYCLIRETMDLYLARAGFEVVALDVSGNPFHLDYLCRKSAPSAAPPRQEVGRDLFDEIRRIQMTPRPAAGGGAPVPLWRRAARRARSALRGWIGS
jgi:SAM-dependent methyltransferase